MKVIYRPAAQKAMDRMPARDRDALKRKLMQFAQTGDGDVVKLAGSKDWRLRHGDWRAILTVEQDVVVIRVAHRREVYR